MGTALPPAITAAPPRPITAAAPRHSRFTNLTPLQLATTSRTERENP